VTTRTRPRRPRLQTVLPRLELATELSRIEVGYRAAMAMEIEHIRPDLIRHHADMAVRMARVRQIAALAALADAYGRQPVVYLIHFDRLYIPYPGTPLRDCAGHYCGWTENLARRLARHATGGGARLLAVVHQAGISWQLARVWPGPRERERQLKRQGGASRRCPPVQGAAAGEGGGPVKLRLHGTADECEEMVTLLESVMLIQSVSEPYPDRGRSVLVRVYVEGIPRGGR